MLMQPNKSKYTKLQKGKIKKLKFKSNILKFIIGLKATSSGIITARQLKAARQTISRKLKEKERFG